MTTNKDEIIPARAKDRIRRSIVFCFISIITRIYTKSHLIITAVDFVPAFIYFR